MSEVPMLPELPQDINKRIDELLTSSGETYRSGDFENAETYFLQAWSLLPEPKLGWEFYSNIMPKSQMLFYRDTKQFEKCLKWLEITRESYGPGRDNTIEFYAATIYFEMGDFERAFEEFDRQFAFEKKLAFEGHDRKYLEFYLSEATKRKMKK